MTKLSTLPFSNLLDEYILVKTKKTAGSHWDIINEIYLRTGLGAIADTLDNARLSKGYKTFQGYDDLVTAIYGYSSIKSFLKDDIRKVLFEEQNPIRNKNKFVQLLTVRLTRYLFEANQFHPVSRAESRLIEEALETLTENESTVLRKRYGIDCETMTLEETGTLLSVTRERVRQIEAKALRKIRHPSRSRRFSRILRPIKERYTEAMDCLSAMCAPDGDLGRQEEYLQNLPFFRNMKKGYEARISFLESKCDELRANQKDPVPVVRHDWLGMTVDDLELSVRSYNCLKKSGIRTLKDICDKTEDDMLRIKDFGRKSLAEIKELLAGAGLSFRQKKLN